MTDRLANARRAMVRDQLVARGISDPRVLDAMGNAPRERFALASNGAPDPNVAYRDGALPVGRGQTLSQPYMVAAMTEALELRSGARVLEIGTGTGYQTAILARLASEVWTVERDAVLAASARTRLDGLGLANIRYRVGDGSLGWDEGAPYDGILVTAGAPEVPVALRTQIAPGGRLVVPVGSREWQRLVRVAKDPEGREGPAETLMECRFVPLVGEEGWDGPR